MPEHIRFENWRLEEDRAAGLGSQRQLAPPSTFLAYVRWVDSKITCDGAVTAEDASGLCENEAAGILVAEDDRSLTLALDRWPAEEEGLRCTICIPKVNITHICRFVRGEPS